MALASSNKSAEEMHAKTESSQGHAAPNITQSVDLTLDLSGEDAHGGWQDEAFRESGRVRESGKVSGWACLRIMPHLQADA